MKGNRYYTPESDAVSDDVTVRGLHVREVLYPKFVDRPAGSEDGLIMSFHDPVQLFFDGAVRPVPAGTTVVFAPWNRHYFGDDRREWSHSWMWFGGRAAGKWLNAEAFPLNRPLPFGAEFIVVRYLEMVYAEVASHAPADGEILKGILDLMFRELARVASPGESRPLPEPFRRIRQYVEVHLHRSISLEELAEAAHLSVSHFSATFRHWFGVSPIRYVLDQRMQRAAVQLLDMNLTVSEVARSVGYDDPLYFSKQFKRVFGKNPTAFRTRKPT